MRSIEYALKNKVSIQRKAWQDFGCNIQMHESETFAPNRILDVCILWKASRALCGFVSASIQNGASQTVSGPHRLVPQKLAVTLHSAVKSGAEIPELVLTPAVLLKPY